MDVSYLCMKILTFTLVLLCKVTYLDGCSKCSMCKFPTTMYDVVQPWRMFSSDPDVDKEHDSRQVRFQETFMYVTFKRGHQTVHEVRYTCKKDMGDNKFWALKRLEGGGDPGRYTCIQFLFRSTNVVQLRIADPTSDQATDICDDSRLKLLPSPLIYFETSTFWTEERNKNLGYNECPLKGGYVMTWTGPDGTKHCDSVSETTKLEAECSRGEGISFLNMAKSCDLPPLKHIDRTHFHFCMANWTDDKYAYTILYNYYGDKDMPCLRFPKKHGDEFDAELFLDGACRTEPDVSHVDNVYVLNLKRKVASDICADLNSDCTSLAMDQCGDDEKKVCRETCSLCPRQARPWESLETPQYLRGEWRRDAEETGKETVSITEKTVNIPSLGDFRYMGSSDCIAGRLLKNKDHSKKRWMDEGNEDILLLSTYDNGCTPRITNLGLYNRSDSVISYRNGHTLPARVKEDMENSKHPERYIEFEESTKTQLCSTTSNIVDIKPLKDRYIAGILDWYNLVRAGDDAPSVPCNIPESTPGEWTTLRMGAMTTDKYDGNCNVIMEPRSEEDHSFTIQFNHCYLKKKDQFRKVFNGSFEMTFTCMGTAQDNYYDDACVFTKTKPNEIFNHDYVSWVIKDYSKEVYMYHVGTCAHTTGLKIKLGEKKAFGLLEFDRFTSISASHKGGIVFVLLAVLLADLLIPL